MKIKSELVYERPRQAAMLVVCLVLTVYFLVKNSAFECGHHKGHGKHHNPNHQDIHWHSCANLSSSFECGTFHPPLDYTNETDTRRAAIAVIRYQAGGGNTSREQVLGSVLLNPGGPGGSGVGFLSRNADNDKGLAKYLDRTLKGRYDLVSFDPRGIGKTWPKVQCFGEDDSFGYFANTVGNYGLPGQHGAKPQKHEIGHLLAQNELVGSKCMAHKNAELFKFMSTPFVCRDMNLLHRALGDEKLNYWGFSYGTVIGNTYAEMFPMDINRLVVDGVVDTPNYYEGLWTHAMLDIEGTLNGFFDECESSPNCALKANEGESIKSTVLNWVDGLKFRPLAALDADPPRILTHKDVNDQLFGAMYSPASWPVLAEKLNSAMNGNLTAILEPLDLHIHAKDTETEAMFAILCSDVNSGLGEKWDIPDFERHWGLSYEQSHRFSIYFAGFTAMCKSVWETRGAERYFGEFNSTTSFPILALGNDFDPVTPGRYADAVAKHRSNAVSVRREGYGHCAMSQPSKCMDEIIGKYFVDGELPAPGIKCEVDSGPFDKADEAVLVPFVHF